MRQRISIPEWHGMAQEGCIIPTRIPIHGNSMYPLVRMDRDLVTIVPLQEMPQVGDIVLFADPVHDRYVLHRVWRATEDRVLTWGDNCEYPDRWMPLDAVWGKVILIERGKRSITPDPEKGLRLARIWHRTGKVYRWSHLQVSRVKCRLKRLVKRRPRNV